MKNRRKLVLGAGALAALLLLLAPSLFHLNRYRKRVAAALGNALGRQVEVGAVGVRLLPWPAIVAENVVVGELPAIGAEPFARMSELRATPRLLSLWTGRPEFSSVVFVEPSVNFSRAQFASETGAAPSTAATATPIAPREFPYIEFRDGRINFKNGDLKSVFFFNEVEGSLYRDGERLQIRFVGKPSRTDRALTGVGQVRLEGVVSPQLELNARLIDAYLSDFLALGTGVDPGIQGKFGVDVRLSGRPAALRFEGRAQLAELHRHDGLPALANSPIQVNFTGSADLPGRRLDLAELRSEAGTITAFGGVRGFLTADRPFEWDLQLHLASAEAGRWIAAVQQFTPRLARDLTGSGFMDGSVHFMRTSAGLSADGAIDLQDLTLRSGSLPPTTADNARVEFAGPIVRLLPVAMAPEGERPITVGLSCDWTTPVQGPSLIQASATGQNLSLAYVAPLAAAMGWPGLPAQGRVSLNAKMTLLRGEAPALGGTIDISRVRWTPPWLAVPVTIHNARFEFAPQRVRVTGIVVEAIDSTITGTVWRGRGQQDQWWQTDLHFTELGADRIATLFANGKPMPESLARLQASGKITASQFHLRNLLLEELDTGFTLAGHRVLLRDARAKLAGGRVTGKVDVTLRGEPEYEAQIKLSDAQSELLAPGLAEGALGGTMQIKTHGRTASEIAAAFEMHGSFTARVLRIQQAALAQALRADRANGVTAEVDVRDRKLHFTKLTVAGPVALDGRGTLSFDRLLEFDFGSFRLSGTLADPRRLSTESSQ